jgi:hypothetical protein
LNLPKVISELVTTQNNFDSVGYANCFSETAQVFDEGKTHKGRREIERWIADANERYMATMKPLSFKQNGTKSIFELKSLAPDTVIENHSLRVRMSFQILLIVSRTSSLPSNYN